MANIEDLPPGYVELDPDKAAGRVHSTPSEPRIIAYVIFSVIVIASLIVRALSYRGDRDRRLSIPRSRRCGDIAVGVTAVLYFAVTGLQVSLLFREYFRVETRVHDSEIGPPVSEHIVYLKIMYTSRTIYSIYIYIIKFGFLSHYVSFSRVTSKKMKLLLWFTVAFNVSAAIGSVVSTAVFCLPVKRAWGVGESEFCNPFLNWRMLLGNSFTNICLDTLVLAYPLRAIIDATWPARDKRRHITTILLIGSWPLIVALVRFFFVVSTAGVDGLLTSPTNDVALATQAEMALLLILVNVPNFKVLYRKLRDARIRKIKAKRPISQDFTTHPSNSEMQLVERRTVEPARSRNDSTGSRSSNGTQGNPFSDRNAARVPWSAREKDYDEIEMRSLGERQPHSWEGDGSGMPPRMETFPQMSSRSPKRNVTFADGAQ